MSYKITCLIGSRTWNVLDAVINIPVYGGGIDSRLKAIKLEQKHLDNGRTQITILDSDSLSILLYRLYDLSDIGSENDVYDARLSIEAADLVDLIMLDLGLNDAYLSRDDGEDAWPLIMFDDIVDDFPSYEPAQINIVVAKKLEKQRELV